MSATSLNLPVGAAIVGTQFAVLDTNNNRVLVWNTIPTVDGLPANLVLDNPI